LRRTNSAVMDGGVVLAYVVTEEGQLMRLVDHRMWIPALALVAFACAPCHRPHAGGMTMGCESGACRYRSECFSEGAIRSNDGVCQTCSAGKWTSATGCREHASHECGGKMGKSPCDRESHHRSK
jgi:hypothetical protein